MLERENEYSPEEFQESAEIALDLETPQGVIQWLSLFIPYFITVELPAIHSSLENQKEREESIEKMQRFIGVFLMLNSYFNECQNNRPEILERMSKHDQEKSLRLASDRRKMARREIARHSEQMFKMDFLPTDLKVPKKLANNFSNQNEFNAEGNSDQIFFLSYYLHDMRNIVAVLRTYLEHFQESTKKVKKISEDELNVHKNFIQEQFTELVFVNEGFNLLNERRVTQEENVTFLVDYIRAFVQKESHNHELNPFLEESDRIDISFDFVSSEENFKPSSIAVVPFSVPSFIRIFTNVVQNIRRYYHSDRDQDKTPEQKRLRVAIRLEEDSFTIIFDDDGNGFPAPKKLLNTERTVEFSNIADTEANVQNSMFDDEPIIPYAVQRKKTAGKGSGLGLFGIKKEVESSNGRFLVGNRTSSTGARVEIALPLISAS